MFYACITIVVVIIALFIGTFLGTRQALNMVINNYTGTAPVEIPGLKLTPEEKTTRIQKLETDFSTAAGSGGTVAMDEVDLNLLLSRTPGVSNYADQIFLRVETNQIKADISMPLDQFAEWKKVATRFRSSNLTGRYLNATLSLAPSLQNQTLQLDLTGIEVNGDPLPETFTGKVDLEKVTEEANQSPEARKVLDRIEAIEVAEGSVKIKMRATGELPDGNP